MSRSLHERGDFIREKMGLAILHDLGGEKINANEAAEVDDLMRDLQASGVTFNIDLARNKYYLNAVASWREYKEAQRQNVIESRRV